MSESPDNIFIGNIDEAAQAFRAWMLKQGAPEDSATQLATRWSDFIYSADGQKFRWRGK